MRLGPAALTLLAATVIATTPGCTSTVVGPAVPQPVALTRFGPTGHSLTAFGGYAQVQAFAIHDSTTMAMVWETIYRNFSPSPTMPVVDFTRDMVVVAALGTRPTGGYEILLDSAARDSDGLIVYFHTVAPSPSSVVAQVVTQPVDAGVVPRTAGVVEFQDLTNGGVAR